VGAPCGDLKGGGESYARLSSVTRERCGRLVRIYAKDASTLVGQRSRILAAG
jgi:hypothetical protein